MTYLLDTNVVSALVKPRPEARVVAWIESVDEDDVFLSVVTLSEIRFGVERLPPGARRVGLEEWLSQDLPDRFEGRILAIDQGVADACGRIRAKRLSAGKPINTMDALIASVAARHGLILVTRNERDFEETGVAIHNPWVEAR